MDETDSPSGHFGLPGKIVLTVKYNTTTGTVEKVTSGYKYVPDVTSNNVTIQNAPAVELNFIKKDFKGVPLDGATITISSWVAGDNIEDISGLDTNKNLQKAENGRFKPIQVLPSDYSKGEFTITINETGVPNGYVGIKGSIKIKVKYDMDGNITGITSNNTDYVPEQNNIKNKNVDISIKNPPAIKLNFEKQDFIENLITGAKINVSSSANVSGIVGLNSEKNLIETETQSGKFKEISVSPEDYTKGYFTLVLKETGVPTGYFGFTGEITLTVYYDKDTGNVKQIVSSNKEYIPDQGGNNVPINAIKIKNSPKIANLTLEKIDALTKEVLPGAEFKITLTGVKSVKDYSGSGNNGIITLTKKKTDSKGKIELKDLVFDGRQTKIKIKIEETGVPEVTSKKYYYDTNKFSPIEFTIQYSVNNGKATFKLLNAPPQVHINSNVVTIKAENIPLIDLSGQVWLDEQGLEKDPTPPDGKKDKVKKWSDIENEYIEIEKEEPKIKGVFVELISNKDGQIKKSNYTNENGEYVFKGIEKTNEGYYIRFSYDGINYIEVKEAGIKSESESEIEDSKPTEKYRNLFNLRFKTISKDKSNDGTPLRYYLYDNEQTTDGTTIAELQVRQNGYNLASNKFDLQMTANTTNYYETTSGVDCGLLKKEFDLNAKTDIVNARLEINDKSVTYDYKQIMDGELENRTLDEIVEGKSSNNEDVNYNLYLYKSDYNYRVKDYKTDGIENNVNSGKPENGYNIDTEKELQAYVTYNVILGGQTSYAATVDEFVYYYDEIYKPYKIQEGGPYQVEINEAERKITFKNAANWFKIDKSNNYRVELNLQFMIDKNSDHYKDLINGSYEAKNIVEITKYSTDEGGLIDKDSAPDNGITNGVITQNEDDTDESIGLKISLKEGRQIKGTVFEDKNNDEYNNEDSAVNDVIVQLIEIKKISGKYYEYIWQETRSGSNEVTTTERNGYVGNGYKNNVAAGSGQYEFKDYIPGNYIIRYIYGDGETYDITLEKYKDSAESIKKYNGQDYKSTTDSKYSNKWYNTAGYEEGQSIARDNEARRLEVMAYSTTIDETVGNHLANMDKEALKNTWMAAETSEINVPVDTNNSKDKLTDSNETRVSGENATKENIVSFDNMNFGLTLRPITKLVLEKHITGLKITPNGTGVQSIVDATANIEDILKNKLKAKGVTEGLATTKSTRDDRGFWKVETDIEELMQGATLETEYTYVIKNESDEDYLSGTLVNAYKNQDKKSYNDVLSEVKSTVKDSMRKGTYAYNTSNNSIGTYLGQYYYTGDKASTDVAVPARIEKNGLEEALNNDLKFDSDNGTSGGDFKKTSGPEEKTVYDTNAEAQKENIKTVIQNVSESNYLLKDQSDYSKKIQLGATLATSSGGELGAKIPSYIAEIVKYSNAAGRRDIDATPGNLSYVHSEDTEMTLETVTVKDKNDNTVKEIGKEEYNRNKDKYELIRAANEEDEFWGETIIITKPTGEDKLSPMQIAIITVTSTAILGVGIVLIKKFALKK